jgi:hypothetical protein
MTFAGEMGFLVAPSPPPSLNYFPEEDYIMNEEHVNWDRELESLNDSLGDDEKGQAQFDIISTKIEGVMHDWMTTKVYARMNEPKDDDKEGVLQVDNDDFEDAIETELGQIACVSVVSLIGQILGDIISEHNDENFGEEQVGRYAELIKEVVSAVLVEGILISQAPGWRDKFDDAMAGIRDLGDLGTIA